MIDIFIKITTLKRKYGFKYARARIPGYEKISLGDSVKIKLAAGGFDGKFISFKGIPENKEHFAIALGKVPTFGRI